jgi:hypothetical protein
MSSGQIIISGLPLLSFCSSYAVCSAEDVLFLLQVNTRIVISLVKQFVTEKSLHFFLERIAKFVRAKRQKILFRIPGDIKDFSPPKFSGKLRDSQNYLSNW